MTATDTVTASNPHAAKVLQARLAQSSLRVKAQDEERARMLRILQMMQEEFRNESAKRTEAGTPRHLQ